MQRTSRSVCFNGGKAKGCDQDHRMVRDPLSGAKNFYQRSHMLSLRCRVGAKDMGPRLAEGSVADPWLGGDRDVNSLGSTISTVYRTVWY